MGTGEINAMGNPSDGLTSHQGGSRNTPSPYMLQMGLMGHHWLVCRLHLLPCSVRLIDQKVHYLQVGRRTADSFSGAVVFLVVVYLGLGLILSIFLYMVNEGQYKNTAPVRNRTCKYLAYFLIFLI